MLRLTPQLGALLKAAGLPKCADGGRAIAASRKSHSDWKGNGYPTSPPGTYSPTGDNRSPAGVLIGTAGGSPAAPKGLGGGCLCTPCSLTRSRFAEREASRVEPISGLPVRRSETCLLPRKNILPSSGLGFGAAGGYGVFSTATSEAVSRSVGNSSHIPHSEA